MLRKIKIIYFWLKTKKLYRQGSYQDAILAYISFAGLVTERSRDRAYYATLLLLNEDYDASLLEFTKISNGEYKDETLNHEETSYITEYSNMYICGLNNDTKKLIHYNNIKLLNVRDAIKNLLPISKNYIGPD